MKRQKTFYAKVTYYFYYITLLYVCHPSPQIKCDFRSSRYSGHLLHCGSHAIIVRVGGGWKSLDRFLLEYDPCRIHKFISGSYGCSVPSF